MSHPPDEENNYERLRDLIQGEERHEEECRDFLANTPYLLFRELRVLEFIHFDSEYRLNSGDADAAISGRVQEEDGTECNRAYIWEVKAPQCSIFREETNNRLIPTNDLIKAENQLLHYYLSAQGDRDFRDAFGITDETNILLGGIIISTENRKVTSDLPPERVEILYRRAKRARNILYSQSGIRLVTWDRVLEHLREPRVGEELISGDVRILEPQAVPEGTISTFLQAEM